MSLDDDAEDDNDDNCDDDDVDVDDISVRPPFPPDENGAERSEFWISTDAQNKQDA